MCYLWVPGDVQCCCAESLLRLACKVFRCDMACCTLLTGDAYNVIGGAGILRPGVCPDRWGFCAWSFLNSNHELLIVEDTKIDVRLVLLPYSPLLHCCQLNHRLVLQCQTSYLHVAKFHTGQCRAVHKGSVILTAISTNV